MFEIEDIKNILKDSPSVNLLKLRNLDVIITFLYATFSQDRSSILSDDLHRRLEDYLDHFEVDFDEENDIQQAFDTNEVKAKRSIKKWADSGFLSNYYNDNGDIVYQLSPYTIKTLNWLETLKKKEFVAAESKFKDIFNQLQELVEFTDEDVNKRIKNLERKKAELDEQIQDLKMGKEVEILEDFQIIPRFDRLNTTARELLSDFKEVEDNFKKITNEIYQKHLDQSLSKSDVLDFTFDALDRLKESHQGKSFYAFWEFLMDRSLQEQWKELTEELYSKLDEKGIKNDDTFLRGIKRYLFKSGKKVYEANDKMAEKLSRIIREGNAVDKVIVKNLIQDIKKYLTVISQDRIRPDLSIELETGIDFNIPFEKRLTYEKKEIHTYQTKPKRADNDFSQADDFKDVVTRKTINKTKLKLNIKSVLNKTNQTTLTEVINKSGGISEGLPELFGYFDVLQDFSHEFNDEQLETVFFDKAKSKSIQIPEILIIK